MATKQNPTEPFAGASKAAPKRARLRFLVKARYLPDVEVDVESESEDEIKAAALAKWGAKSTDQVITWTRVDVSTAPAGSPQGTISKDEE